MAERIDYAPDILRQRLVIEGIYTFPQIKEIDLIDFLILLSHEMRMHVVYGPKVMDLAGEINPKHAGLEGIMIWAESGVQCYTWEKQKFFTCDIYSCKQFDVEKTVAFVKDFFMAEKITHKSV